MSLHTRARVIRLPIRPEKRDLAPSSHICRHIHGDIIRRPLGAIVASDSVRLAS